MRTDTKIDCLIIIAALGLVLACRQWAPWGTVHAAASTRQPKTKIELVYQAQENGDYRLFLFGEARSLVCEEQAIQVVQQGDAENPVVIECQHAGGRP